MANINDYLLWRGDIKFSNDFPLNEVDAMILGRFSYLIFNKIKMENKETIESIYNKMKDFNNDEFRYNGDKELITNLAKSTRFKNMMVTDFVEIKDRDIEKQFGAITIHLPNNEMYISYIGTDSSISGWKEDFNMSFMESVPCQISGKEYLENISKKYPLKRIRIGGHSKGGNVAIYSAITASSIIQKRIIKVYNYDGPGFSKNIIEKYENNEVVSKIETYLPQDSIIGRILYHKEKRTVILSIEKGILQHDIFSWQVLRDDIVKLDKNTDSSEDIDKTITEWLEANTYEQRKAFIDGVFELFYSTEANTFGKMSKDFSTNIHIVMKKYKGFSKEEKDTIIEMIKKAINFYLSNVSEREKKKINILKEEYTLRGRAKIEELERKIKNNRRN